MATIEEYRNYIQNLLKEYSQIGLLNMQKDNIYRLISLN